MDRISSLAIVRAAPTSGNGIAADRLVFRGKSGENTDIRP
jgi:hypothetical protein